MNLEKNTSLLIIDVQKGLDDEVHYGGNRNNRYAEKKMKQLLEFWRKNNLPIFHIQHSSTNLNSKLHPSQPGYAIKEIVLPMDGEEVIVKSANSAFIGTNLEERLKNSKINAVVLIGLTTNHCVSSTARMAANLGFRTLIISDATATFDRMGIKGQKFDSELVHQVTLANLQDEFAEVLSAEELLKLIEV